MDDDATNIVDARRFVERNFTLDVALTACRSTGYGYFAGHRTAVVRLDGFACLYYQTLAGIAPGESAGLLQVILIP